MVMKITSHTSALNTGKNTKGLPYDFKRDMFYTALLTRDRAHIRLRELYYFVLAA